MQYYTDKILSILKIKHSIDSFEQLVHINRRIDEKITKEVIKESNFLTQGIYKINETYYFDILISKSKKYYYYNLDNEDSIETVFSMKFLRSPKSYINPLTKYVPDCILFNTIDYEFENKLEQVLKWKANAMRNITDIETPHKSKVSRIVGKTITMIHGNFYHGYKDNGDYNVLGMFISNKCILKITFNVKSTYEVYISNVSIPLYYKDCPETFGKLSKTKYGRYISFFESKGYRKELRKKNPFIMTMRPTYYEGNFENIQYPVIASEKKDGVRCQLIYDNDFWIPYSRRGLILNNVSSLANVTRHFPESLKQFVLNLEIMWIGHGLNELTGVLNSDLVPDNFYNELRFYLFDLTPRSEKNYCILDNDLNIIKTQEKDYFIDRMNNVIKVNNYFIRSNIKELGLIRSVRIEMFRNPNDLEKMYNKVIEDNGEGIVFCSNLQNIYSPGRNKDLHKKKKFKDIEVTLSNIIKGYGQFSNRAIGKFYYKGKEYSALINGSQEQSLEYLKNKDHYINKFVTIRVVASEEIRHPNIIDMQPYK